MLTHIIGEDAARTLALSLPLPSLGRAVCVCKAWRSFLVDDFIWQCIALRMYEHWPFSAEWPMKANADGHPAKHPLVLSGWRAALYYRHTGETSTGVSLTQPAKRLSVAQMFMKGASNYRPQKRREKIPGAPHAPTSSYFHFCETFREGKKAKVATAEISAAWRGLSEAQRGPHETAAKVDRARYAIEKGLWIKGFELEDLRPRLHDDCYAKRCSCASGCVAWSPAWTGLPEPR